MNALSLANFILANYPNKQITPLKLQKLAYYAKVWSLVAGNLTIQANFEKWAYGPVNQAIFHKYKCFGKDIISVVPSKPTIDETLTQLLTFILDNYVNYSAFTLSSMTHDELPWISTSHDETISEQTILDFYCLQPFAKNFVQNKLSTNEFHVLQTESWHSFTLDMSANDIENLEVFPSYAMYQNQKKQAEIEFANFLETFWDEPV